MPILDHDELDRAQQQDAARVLPDVGAADPDAAGRRRRAPVPVHQQPGPQPGGGPAGRPTGRRALRAHQGARTTARAGCPLPDGTRLRPARAGDRRQPGPAVPGRRRRRASTCSASRAAPRATRSAAPSSASTTPSREPGSIVRQVRRRAEGPPLRRRACACRSTADMPRDLLRVAGRAARARPGGRLRHRRLPGAERPLDQLEAPRRTDLRCPGTSPSTHPRLRDLDRARPGGRSSRRSRAATSCCTTRTTSFDTSVLRFLESAARRSRRCWPSS